MRTLHCHLTWLLGLLLVSLAQPALADRWIEYYRTGGGEPVEWELNEVDLDSIKRVETFLRYSVRVRYPDGNTSSPLEMQVDCVSRTRGQLPDPFMRDTYNGTLGREEVKAVCLAGAREGK
jgi:hypothetical protein